MVARMEEMITPNVRFEGFGVTAVDAAGAARALAEALDGWATDHPGRRILRLSVQSAASANGLELTALIAYVTEPEIAGAAAVAGALAGVEAQSEAVARAEEIVAEAQDESP
jgi:hypothetical protein